MIITNSRYALVGYFITSYPTRAHGIIVKYLQIIPRAVLDHLSSTNRMVSNDAAAWCVCPCVYLEAQIKSTFISHNSFCIFSIKPSVYNKTIIEFGSCAIRDNQSRGKCNQPRLEAVREREKFFQNFPEVNRIRKNQAQNL